MYGVAPSGSGDVLPKGVPMGSNLPIPDPGLDASMRYGCICVNNPAGYFVFYSECPAHGINAQPERWKLAVAK